ncbi:MAG: hypothetical protein HYV27_03920 [Candidatus Hydrogenedentes bacterium]|nr:hypothetical protein [Candidatus Hydrogenedentota bacterium]
MAPSNLEMPACARCGWSGSLAPLDAEGARRCPACGHVLGSTSADDVIEVDAVPVGGLPAASEPDYSEDPFFDPALQEHPPEYGWRGQSVQFERTYRGGGGCGCCLGGCLMAVVLIYLLFRGLASVLFGV